MITQKEWDSFEETRELRMRNAKLVAALEQCARIANKAAGSDLPELIGNIVKLALQQSTAKP